MFNQEQIKSAVRWVLASVSGLIIGWATARGWDISGLMSIFQSDAVVAAGVSIVTLVWGYFSNRFSSLIIATSKSPQVTEIAVTDRDLAVAVKDAAQAQIVVKK